MTPIEFSASLNVLTDLLNSAGASNRASIVRELATIFLNSKDNTASEALKKLKGLKVTPSSLTAELAEIAGMLSILVRYEQAAGGRSHASLIERFSTLVRDNSDVSVLDFVDASIQRLNAVEQVPPPIRETVVRNYVKKLEEALGDEGFVFLHRQLSEDPNITAPEILAIARQFSGKRPTGKIKALEAIIGRHRTLMTFRAKDEARAGRSAA